MIGFWYDGFCEFLTFAMQMVLILLTEYHLVFSRVYGLIDFLGLMIWPGLF